MGKKEHIHLLGVGGIGMAALAGLLKESGAYVTGSDSELYSPTREMLEDMGLEFKKGYSEDNLKPVPDIVVIGNVIKRGNPEAEYVMDNGLEFCSMPIIVKERFLKGKKTIVVAGTHGKTTTASLLSHIYSFAGKDPGYLIGGIPKNLGRSYHFGSGESFIIEGDEYETSFFDKGSKFMHYMPNTLILGAIEYDHADIFNSLEEVILQFKKLVNIVPSKGKIIGCWDSENVKKALRKSFSEIESFGFHKESFWRVLQVKQHEGWTEFDLCRNGKYLKRFRMRIPGHFNILNATAAVAASYNDLLDLETIAKAIESFKGTHRRLDLIGSYRGVTVYDDFAHHPTAIRETLKVLREIYKDRKIWAVFEPRSWSLRRNVFENELVPAFNDADEIIIAPVYKAEQIKSSECLDVTRIINELNKNGEKACYVKEGVDQIIKKLIEELHEGDVVVIMSNGNFDNIYDKLLDNLSH